MIHLLVRQKVADFGHWKSVYDARQSAREMAGVREKYLLRNIENRNEVVIYSKRTISKKPNL